MKLKLKKADNALIIGLCVGFAAMAVTLGMILLFLSGNKPAQNDNKDDTAAVSGAPLLPPNPFTPDDFSFLGDYLTCTAAPSVLGVDVSRFQGEIDWEQVRQAGIEFVMLRAGGRGYGEEGAIYEDSLAQQNYLGAKQAGLKVGAYFFSQATSAEEAQQEADFLLQQICDWELDMPVVYDWENMGAGSRTENVDTKTLVDCTVAFCEIIRRTGRTPMVYFNPDQSEDPYYLQSLKQYDFWLAFYTEEMTFPHRVDMWQYTDCGTVPGIDAPVDLNLYFPDIKKQA